MTDKKMNVTYVKDMDSLIRGNVIENNVAFIKGTEIERVT